MESRLLKFAAIVDSGSFSQAAKELHISQPALSVAIHKLERELQTTLFIPGSRPLALTESGKLAYQAAKEIGISTGNLHTRLAEVSERSVSVRIGMIDSIATSIFSQKETANLLAVGDTALSVTVDNSRMLTNAVEQDDIDLACIAGEPRSVSPHLLIKPVGSEPLVTVCASTQAAAMEASLASGTLPQLISYDQRSNTYRLIQEALHQRGIVIQTSVYSTSPEITLYLVRHQYGPAILPYQTVAPWLASGDLSLIGTARIGTIPRPISVVQRRDKLLPKQAHRLMREVRRTLLASTEAAEKALNSLRA